MCNGISFPTMTESLKITILGAFIGLVLVIIWEFLKKPRVCFTGFKRTNFNYPRYLYKLEFLVWGFSCHGYSEIIIKWNNDKRVKAKWDELPNPLRNDSFDNFIPELVPNTTTYFIVNRCRTFSIPIIHEDQNGNYTIFSGWWFGRNSGYGRDVPQVSNDLELEIEFVSQSGGSKSRKYTVQEIVGRSIPQ